MHRMSLCVVGKVLSNIKVNREAFMRVFRRIWQVDKGLDIESVTGNMFTFHFRDEDDMSRVISGSLGALMMHLLLWRDRRVRVLWSLWVSTWQISGCKYTKCPFFACQRISDGS
ncbi:hypothetical protein Dsin_022234 [Dipteronia sinensis]|uniref:DUF4283 domain-containing protein n=1 Tax=Dipteronia sinensis TaxID=43782 RepID=A0AAE0DZV8_9ROSI|nr:hypothetical protein Dsin_022234 [Dipteronia sinensis]